MVAKPKVLKRLVDIVRDFEDDVYKRLYPDFPRDQLDQHIRGKEVAEVIAGHVEHVLRPKLIKLLETGSLFLRQSGLPEVAAPKGIFNRSSNSPFSVLEGGDYVCFAAGTLGSGSNPDRSQQLFASLSGAEIFIDTSHLELETEDFNSRERRAIENCEQLDKSLWLELKRLKDNPSLPKIRSKQFKEMAVVIAGLKHELARSIWDKAAQDPEFSGLGLSKRPAKNIHTLSPTELANLFKIQNVNE